MLWGRLITARATANQLLLLRLVFHPIIWGVMSLMFQHTARWIGELSPTASVTRDALPCTILARQMTGDQTCCCLAVCSAARCFLAPEQMQRCTRQHCNRQELGHVLSASQPKQEPKSTGCLNYLQAACTGTS